MNPTLRPSILSLLNPAVLLETLIVVGAQQVSVSSVISVINAFVMRVSQVNGCLPCKYAVSAAPAEDAVCVLCGGGKRIQPEDARQRTSERRPFSHGKWAQLKVKFSNEIPYSYSRFETFEWQYPRPL